MALDPVLLEVMNQQVASIAEQMSAHLQRASRSMYVKEAADFGVGLADLGGKMFAYPRGANMFSIDRPCGALIEAVPDVEEGDVIFSNDPFLSKGLSTHLPDLHMLRPIYHQGRIVCYAWAFIHFTDMGGSVPSSIAPSLTELFQEGIRFPPLKIVREGRISQDFVTLFRANVRTPDANMGDVRALLGALETAAARVRDLIESQGVDAFMACQEQLQAYAETKARAVIRTIPDGSYQFWDYMDDDFFSPIPVRLRVVMTIAGDTVHLDFTGTDPAVESAYNVPTMGMVHYWVTMRLTTFICTRDSSTPLNAGLYRPMSVTSPPGTILHAEFPDPVGIRSASARRLNDAVSGALSKAVPDIMAAPTCGASVSAVISEFDADSGRRKVVVIEPMRGGMGGAPGVDGVDARDVSVNNMNNHPIESIEMDAGITVRAYDVHTDSGGPGRWRGGCGQTLTFEVLKDGGIVLARGMERQRFPAWGVSGGKRSRPLRAIKNRGRPDEQVLGKIDQLRVDAGDTLTLLMPGAPGYGDPFLRDPDRVRDNAAWGFVSIRSAREDYGVALREDGSLDREATEALRRGRVRENLGTDFDFGPDREAWEAVFDDATMLDLNRRLFALPRSTRIATRRRVFREAVPDLWDRPGIPLAEAIGEADAARARLKQVMATLPGPAVTAEAAQ